jgi:putative ABC transport system ATP-binding protein
MGADGIAVFSRDITKVFGRGDTQVHALRGLDLDINLGELTMLVGPSGSGKTTLLSVITGLLDATSGELVVLGQRPGMLSGEDLILFRRKNLGFVFQQYNLIPALTAAKNVAVPLLAGGVARRLAVARGKELLATLGMAHRAPALPSALSGGEQQRVALARALIHEPRLIVCDEPTLALDGRTGHAVIELLRATAVRPDRAVIIVTHDARLFDFAHRIAHMDDGRIVTLEKDRKNGAATNGLAPGSATLSLAGTAARPHPPTGDSDREDHRTCDRGHRVGVCGGRSGRHETGPPEGTPAIPSSRREV